MMIEREREREKQRMMIERERGRERKAMIFPQSHNTFSRVVSSSSPFHSQLCLQLLQCMLRQPVQVGVSACVRVYVIVCAYACVCVCACVCGYDKERETCGAYGGEPAVGAVLHPLSAYRLKQFSLPSLSLSLSPSLPLSSLAPTFSSSVTSSDRLASDRPCFVHTFFPHARASCSCSRMAGHTRYTPPQSKIKIK